MARIPIYPLRGKSARLEATNSGPNSSPHINFELTYSICLYSWSESAECSYFSPGSDYHFEPAKAGKSGSEYLDFWKRVTTRSAARSWRGLRGGRNLLHGGWESEKEKNEEELNYFDVKYSTISLDEMPTNLQSCLSLLHSISERGVAAYYVDMMNI